MNFGGRMGLTSRYQNTTQFEEEALTVQDCLPEVTIKRVRDALAKAQGYDDASELLTAMNGPAEPPTCLEMRTSTGELYFCAPTRPHETESWVLALGDIARNDPDLAVINVLSQRLDEGVELSEGYLNVELLGLDRLGELSDLIDSFCEQNSGMFYRGALFELMKDVLILGATDTDSDVCDILTDAYAAVIEGCEVNEIVHEEVKLRAVLGDRFEHAVKLACQAYSETSLEEATKSLSLRGNAPVEAAAEVLMGRDFRLIVEVMFATILMQSDPGCIDSDMMAGYVNQYEDGMARNARLSVFAGERLLT
jgi:hypothetical protein